jgi:hypothetical protein
LILNEWIVAQNNRAFATEEGSNKILYGLEALLSEYELKPNSFELEYGIRAAMFKTATGEIEQIIFEVSTGRLHRAFNILAKERGIVNQFKSPSQLGARIGDSLEILKKSGWKFKQHAVVLHGERKHHFVRQFVRHDKK